MIKILMKKQLKQLFSGFLLTGKLENLNPKALRYLE